MKKIETHLAIPLSVILASCQLLCFSSAFPPVPPLLRFPLLVPKFSIYARHKFKRFDNLAATLDLCIT